MLQNFCKYNSSYGMLLFFEFHLDFDIMNRNSPKGKNEKAIQCSNFCGYQKYVQTPPRAIIHNIYL